jgi:hypothetical protein
LGIQVTLVSADGSVYIANETENTDLFFGVRGGGCNFGVVTEFVLALHLQRATIFAGPVIFPGDYLEKVVNFAQEWYPSVSEKEAMLMMTTVEPDGSKRVSFANLTISSCRANVNGSSFSSQLSFAIFFTTAVKRKAALNLGNSMISVCGAQFIPV